MTRRQSRLASLLSGVLVAVSMPPWGFWPGAFAGAALLFSLRTDRWQDQWVLGMLFGISWFGPTTAWMYFLTAPGYVAAVLFFAVLHAFAAAVPTRSRFGRVGAHSLVEMARSSCHSAAFRLQRSASVRQGATPSNRPAWGRAVAHLDGVWVRGDDRRTRRNPSTPDWPTTHINVDVGNVGRALHHCSRCTVWYRSCPCLNCCSTRGRSTRNECP